MQVFVPRQTAYSVRVSLLYLLHSPLTEGASWVRESAEPQFGQEGPGIRGSSAGTWRSPKGPVRLSAVDPASWSRALSAAPSARSGSVPQNLIFSLWVHPGDFSRPSLASSSDDSERGQ